MRFRGFVLSVFSLALAGLLLAPLLSCGAGSAGIVRPENAAPAVSLERIGTNPVPAYDVKRMPDGVAIALSSDGAAFARISFDPSAVHFASLDSTSGAWTEGRAVTAAIPVEPGVVDFGAAPIAANGDAPGLGGAVILLGNGGDFSAGRRVSIAPTSAGSAVPDFFMLDNGAGGATCTWHYRNQGDYEQNGEVSIADITPIALHYLATVSGPGDPNAPIDGDGTGEVSISDITPIAINYLKNMTDYQIEYSVDASAGTFAMVVQVPRTDGVAPGGGGFLAFSHDISPAPDGYYRVVPYDAVDSTAGIPSTAIEWRGGLVVTLTIVLATAGVTGTGTELDPYIFDQVTPYDFTASKGADDVTGQVAWTADPGFAVSWSGTTPGETGTILDIAGDFSVYGTLVSETSNIIYCRKPLVIP